jgi:hypothetical protein
MREVLSGIESLSKPQSSDFDVQAKKKFCTIFGIAAAPHYG